MSDSKGADWREYLEQNHPELDKLLHEYRKACWDTNAVNGDRWAVEKKIVALLAQEVNKARIDELKEIQMSDNVHDAIKDSLYQSYIGERIKDLERLG